ncbi:hypothetical protein [Streptomyces sp. GbtcB6]|uniref:hypothetical protein n=1 Tax=Streptomyces sp. GbtcB6 TaxID=2824751 RepID=UPI001C30A026|nr:hypothetical protein [Streptomyces sp. GbtcB6]
MPELSIRPDVVVLLTEWDTSRRDPDHLYRRDGNPFTAAEHDLICTCTQEEIDAAIAQKRLANDLVHEHRALQEALVGLATKYVDPLPDGTLPSNVYALMTDEDYAECGRLVEALRTRDPFRYRYLYEEN